MVHPLRGCRVFLNSLPRMGPGLFQFEPSGLLYSEVILNPFAPSETWDIAV
jgi:hypothetical protein